LPFGCSARVKNKAQEDARCHITLNTLGALAGYQVAGQQDRERPEPGAQHPDPYRPARNRKKRLDFCMATMFIR
jgi:hypothetical protein